MIQKLLSAGTQTDTVPTQANRGVEDVFKNIFAGASTSTTPAEGTAPTSIGSLAQLPPAALPNATLAPEAVFPTGVAAGRGIAERLAQADEPTIAVAFAGQSGKVYVYLRELNEFPGNTVEEKAAAAVANINSAAQGARARGLIPADAQPILGLGTQGSGQQFQIPVQSI